MGAGLQARGIVATVTIMNTYPPRCLLALLTAASFALVFALFATDAHAQGYSSKFPPKIRCSGDLITIGDKTAKLAARCGQPTSIGRTSAYRSEEPVYSTDANGNEEQIGTETVDHPEVEEWFYYRGTGQFHYMITVSEGRITDIQQHSYGGLGRR